MTGSTKSEEYLDCELYLSGYNQAVLRTLGTEYSGKPNLDEEFQRRLLQASLDLTQYGTLLFEALFPYTDNLLVGYRSALAIARHGDKRLRFRLHIDRNAPSKLHALNWELLYDVKEKLSLSRSRDTVFSRYLSVDKPKWGIQDVSPKMLVVFSTPTDASNYQLPTIDREQVETSL